MLPIADTYFLCGTLLNPEVFVSLCAQQAYEELKGVFVLAERDRGAQGFRKIKAKLDDYADYARYPERFKNRFKVLLDKFVVLFITTKPKRVANIEQKHRHHVGFKRVLLTTLDQFTAITNPSAPIWTREAGEEIGLIRPA